VTSARQLVSAAAAVLLDFDGPVTVLLPPPANAEVADAARSPLLAAGLPLPAAIARTTDHLAVLRYAGTLDDDTFLPLVERVCVDAESLAAARSRPAPGGHEFIRYVHNSGRPLVIVTNNAREAVIAYLKRFELVAAVDGIAAREPHLPTLMKPHPASIRRGLAYAGTTPNRAILVGDSVTDVEAASAVAVPCIGLAKDTARADELRSAGAIAVVRSMTEIAQATF